MSCFVVGELEEQRRELEARRAMLEERFKLRVATAQEFGVIHTRRLDRMRDAFVKQSDAARKRNQDVVQHVCRTQSKEELFGGSAALRESASYHRLSSQIHRFLSAAEKMYPAWQEQQLHRKATELRALEEERFLTEQRRKAAQDRFLQEQAIGAAVEERRQLLATARIHERNDAALRRSLREHSTSRAQRAEKRVLEQAVQFGHVARHEAETMHQQCENDRHYHQNGYHQNRDQRENLDADALSRTSPIDGDGECYHPATAVGGGDVEVASASSFHDNPRAAGGQMGVKHNIGHESTRVPVVQPSNRAEGTSGSGARRGIAGRGERGGDWIGEADTTPRDSGWQNNQRAFQEQGATRTNTHDFSSASPKSKKKEAAAAAAAVAANLRARCLSKDDSLLLPEPPAITTTKTENPTIAALSRGTGSQSTVLPRPPQGDTRSGQGVSRMETRPSAPSATGSQGSWDEPASLGQQVDDGNSLSKQESQSALYETVAVPAAVFSWSDRDDVGGDGVDGYELYQQQLLPFEGLEKPSHSLGLSRNKEKRQGRDDEDTASRGKIPNDGQREGTSVAEITEGRPITAEVQAQGPASLSTAARTLVALTLSIENLADQEAGGLSRTGEGQPSPLAFSILLDSYTSARTTTSPRSVQAALIEAAVDTPDAHVASGDSDKNHANINNTGKTLEGFGLNTLCLAVLHVVSNHADDILPEQLLSGLVTAGKVRAQHRKRGPPGRVQLFDAIFTHIRRLAASGEVEPAAVASIFAPCFESVPGGPKRTSADQRLRRKVLALLEAAADPERPAPTKAPLATHKSIGATTPRTLGETGDSGRGTNASCAREGRVGFESKIAAQPRIGTKAKHADDNNGDSASWTENRRKSNSGDAPDASRDRQAKTRYSKAVSSPAPQKQKQRAASSGSLVEPDANGLSKARRASGNTSPSMASSGVVLGRGGRLAGKKKGGLDLSAIMGVPTSFFGAGGHSLPEFEIDELLDESF